jgi:hypothetical protein
MIEMEVQKVDLPYLSRDTLGRYKFENQTHGTASSPLPKRQIITVSGPELDTFLPVDLFDSYQILTTTLANADNYILDTDSNLKSVAINAGLTRLPMSIADSGTTISSWTLRNSSNSKLIYASRRPAPVFISSDGTSYSTATYRILLTANPPDWLKELGINVIPATISGKVYYIHRWDLLKGGTRYPFPEWGESISWDESIFGPGVYTSNTDSGDEIEVRWTNFSIQGFIITNNYDTATTLYRPADYSFINPPAGLAQFLKECQDYVPYEGTINLVQEDVGATRYIGSTISISNTLSEYLSMRSLVKSETLTVETGETQISLGQADRLDYRTLVDRIRKTSQDNIYYV